MSDFFGLPDPEAVRNSQSSALEAKKLGRGLATIFVGVFYAVAGVKAAHEKKRARLRAQQEMAARARAERQAANWFQAQAKNIRANPACAKTIRNCSPP
jgi:hypothetical protein